MAQRVACPSPSASPRGTPRAQTWRTTRKPPRKSWTAAKATVSACQVLSPSRDRSTYEAVQAPSSVTSRSRADRVRGCMRLSWDCGCAVLHRADYRRHMHLFVMFASTSQSGSAVKGCADLTAKYRVPHEGAARSCGGPLLVAAAQPELPGRPVANASTTRCSTPPSATTYTRRTGLCLVSPAGRTLCVRTLGRGVRVVLRRPATCWRCVVAAALKWRYRILVYSTHV